MSITKSDFLYKFLQSLSVCVFVCLSRFCYHGNTPLYLNQMKSDLHKTFSIISGWSPKLVNNVCGCACARVHAQRVKTCTQLGQFDTPQFLCQMTSDFHKTWYDHERGIKNALNEIWEQYVHAHNVRKCARTFL